MQLQKIRYYQLKRDLGILFFVIIAVLIGTSYFIFNHPKLIGYYAVGLIFYLFYNFHQKRNDKSFILKHFNNPIQQLVIEYQLFLLPLSIPCLLSSYWFCFPILHILVLAIPFIKAPKKIELKLFSITHFFKNDYIFIAGIRKNILQLILFLIVALVLSPVKLFGLVALFLFNMIVFSFYDTNECVQLLQASKQSPSYFLFSKFNSALVKLLIVNITCILINSVFNTDMIAFNLYFLMYMVLMLASVIAMKYENYQYNKTENNNQMKLAIIILGLFIPYLSILAIAFLIQSRQSAIKNLRNYLDDNN